MGRIIFSSLDAATMVVCQLRNIQRSGVANGPENWLEESNDF